MATNRSLSPSEHALIHWMLTHGGPAAAMFIPQLANLQVLPNRCTCGCASLNFQTPHQGDSKHNYVPVANFLFGPDDDLAGIILYRENGFLAGLEVYGTTEQAPQYLPAPEDLWLPPENLLTPPPNNSGIHIPTTLPERPPEA